MKLFAFKSNEELALVVFRLNSIMAGASRRNKDFSMSLVTVRNIYRQTHCAYSGEAFGEGDDGLSLERIDCNLGYVDGNVIPVKLKYNSFRGNHTIESLKEIQELGTNGKLSDDETALRAKYIEWIELNESRIKNQEMAIEEKKLAVERHKKHNEPEKAEAAEKAIKNTLFRMEERYQKIADLKQALSEINKKEEKLKAIANNTEIVLKYTSVLIESLSKYENLTPAQKERVKYGLPIDASWIELMKAKVGL